MAEEKKEEVKEDIEKKIDIDYKKIVEDANHPKHQEAVNNLIDDLQGIRFKHFYDKLKDSGYDFEGKSDDEVVTAVREQTKYKFNDLAEAERFNDTLATRVLDEVAPKQAKSYRDAIDKWYKGEFENDDEKEETLKELAHHRKVVSAAYGYDWHTNRFIFYKQGFQPGYMNKLSEKLIEEIQQHKSDMFLDQIVDEDHLRAHLLKAGKEVGFEFNKDKIAAMGLQQLKGLLSTLYTRPTQFLSKGYEDLVKQIKEEEENKD